MAYKPQKIQTGGFLTGIASVQLHKDGKRVRVQMLDDEDKTFIIDRKECPEYIMTGEFVVTLSSKGDHIYSMRPVDGLFLMRTQKFVSDGEQPPAPKTINVKPDKGNAYSFEAFTVLLEIVSGKENGMVVPYNLRYHFVPAEEEVTIKGKKQIAQVVALGHLKSKYTAALEEYLDVTHAWDRGPIPYQDNILPSLEKRILRENVTFNVLMKSGWVDKVFPKQGDVQAEKLPDSGESEELDEVADEVVGTDLSWDEAEATE